MSLFVGNLSSHVQHGELERIFRRFGRSNLELKDGYGFVVFDAYKDAERALGALQGRNICGEHPSITWARKHRPFRSFSSKESSLKVLHGNTEGPVDKISPPKKNDHVEGFKRRRSPDVDKISPPKKNDHGELGDGIVGRKSFRDSEPRDDVVDDGARRDWNEQAPEELIVQGVEPRDLDPLNNGRWGEPLSEGSSDHIYGEVIRDYDEASHDKGKGSEKNVQDKLHDSASDMSPEQSSYAYAKSVEQTKRRSKGKEAMEGRKKNVQDKSHGSYSDRSPEPSSRAYLNSEEQSRRRHDSLGKSQERCYICGKIGHIMRYCRARTNFNFSRERFDGRRFQFRGLRGNGFRRLGGRFRGMEMSRRGLNRDMDASYGRRTFRRQGFISDKKIYEEVDIMSRGKHKHRYQHSDSQRDSPTRERSRRCKNSRKRSTSRSRKRSHKRRRSSSESKSPSSSHSDSSSSSSSQSHSLSSRSNSRSSKSRNRSSSSRSVSPRNSSRSRSLSRSSHSRSCSRSSKSGRSNAKSHSHSSKSHSRSASQSGSPQLKSESRSAHLSSSSLHGNSQNSPGTSQESGKRSLSPHINKHEGETLLAGTSFSYHETTGHLLETSRDTSKRLLHPVVTDEMQATKKLKLDDEEGVMGATGIIKQKRGDGKQEEVILVMKRADCSNFSAREGLQEAQKESSWCDSRDSLNIIGQKNEERVGWNHFAEHPSRNSEEVVKGLDISIAGNTEEKLSKDQTNAKWQDERISVSLEILAPVDHLVNSAECESVTQESQNFAFNVHLADIKGSGTRGVPESGGVQHPAASVFGAARLWPWESILYRRLKRGPISIANYERRKTQNENFYIVDKFVRSSSGWWERALD